MTLLTINRESGLVEAGYSAIKCISCFSRKFLLVCVRTPRYKVFFAYTASAEIQSLHSKWRMVILSTEFGSARSHENGLAQGPIS